jgi:hypothetical protein
MCLVNLIFNFIAPKCNVTGTTYDCPHYACFSFLKSSVTSSLLDPNILLNILFSEILHPRILHLWQKTKFHTSIKQHYINILYYYIILHYIIRVFYYIIIILVHEDYLFLSARGGNYGLMSRIK